MCRLAKSVTVVLLLVLWLLVQHDRGGFADAASLLPSEGALPSAQHFARAPPSKLLLQQQQQARGQSPGAAAAAPLRHYTITTGFLRVSLRSRPNDYFACPNAVGQMVAPDRHNSCGQEFFLRKAASRPPPPPPLSPLWPCPVPSVPVSLSLPF
jgi:hypothetical protein